MQPWETFRANARKSVEPMDVSKKDRQKIFNKSYDQAS
jgi:hypothetical protein